MDRIIKKIEAWFTLEYDTVPPAILDEYCKTEASYANVKVPITSKLNRILRECNTTNFRIGIVGRAPNRTEKLSCKKEMYSRMFLLYKSKTKEDVFQLERHYQSVYSDDPDKVRYGGDNDFNITKAISDYYYLYLLV